jgi:peptidoglycan/xylan/chitin deacetylase (PgdA/CDA1 family)
MTLEMADGIFAMIRKMKSWGMIRERMIARFYRTRFAREALEGKADLSSLQAKPTPRVWAGLALIAFSYIIGWPAVGLLAWVSYLLREPLIIAVGGPLTYGLSHLVFLFGSYFAGVHYANIFLRWAMRCLLERLAVAPPGDGSYEWPRPSRFPVEASAAIKNGAVNSREQGVLSPALITGVTAFFIAGLLLWIRPTLVVVPLGFFILLCLVAPFLTRAGFFLTVISRQDRGRSVTALTFDDGPDPDVTPLLLEVLRRHGVQATFFVTGAKAKQHPELIREILSRGHALGNHSYHHDPLLMLRSRTRLKEEIARTQDLLANFAVRPLTFRPPVGITNPRLKGVLRELGMYCVTFSCRAFDRGNRRIEKLAKIILKKVRPGAIILLHDVTPRGGGGIAQWLTEMERMVSGLKMRGYEILPLSELIDRPVMEHLTANESNR